MLLRELFLPFSIIMALCFLVFLHDLEMGRWIFSMQDMNFDQCACYHHATAKAQASNTAELF
jgi:hypothetical protein